MSKIFPFRWGSLDKNFFSQSEHVSSQIWCQKFFPLLGRGGHPSTKIFFPSLNMYQAKFGVKNVSLYWGGVPQQKFFFWSEHVSSQIWCQKFLPLLRLGTPLPPDLRPGTPPDLRPGTPLDLRLGTPPDLDLGPPHLDLDLGPPYLDLGPPYLDLGSPPQSEQTDIFKYKYYLPSYYVRGR